MEKQGERKNVRFVRIGGRVVPIAVGGALVHSSLRDRKIKTANGIVTKTHIPFTSRSLFMFKKSGDKLATAGALTRPSGKVGEKISYIDSWKKRTGSGKNLLSAIASDASERGKKFFRGNVISSDTLNFSKKEKSKFLYSPVIGKGSVPRVVSASTVKAGIRHKVKGFHSSTKIPSVLWNVSSRRPLSVKMGLGMGRIGYGVSRKE
jgi:hypothetical protein